MKKLIRMLTLGVIAVVLAVPAFARLNAEHATTVVQDDDAKNALYTKVTDNITTNQQVAYEAAKEYLQKWPNDDDPIAKYLKDFVAKYDKAMRKQKCTDLVAAKKWTEAYPLCKELATEQRDDLAANLNVSWAGWQLAASGINTNNSEATNFSTKSIQLIEAGKTIEVGKPFPDKAKFEALGWLNYSLYLYSVNNKQVDAAAGYLIKAAQNENPFKNDPNTYLKLVSIYGDEFEKRSADYKTQYDGKPKTPEGDAAFERVKQEADLLIDAIARAIAYSGTDPKTQQARDDLKKTLTDYYKFRNGSVDGIDALIAGIKSKPIPQPGTAAAPVPVTSSTPATADNTAASGTKTSAATPASATTPASTTTTKPNATQTGTQGSKPATAPAGTNGRRPRNR